MSEKTPEELLKQIQDRDYELAVHCYLSVPAQKLYDAYTLAEQQRKQAVDDLEKMIKTTYSHVDGRDLLAELKPNHWHFCNIRVRINGQWAEYEGDWLKRLYHARPTKEEKNNGQ